MKRKHILIYILVLSLSLSLLCACSKPHTLAIYSADYPDRHELASVPIEELTDEKLDEMNRLADSRYTFYVSLTPAYGDDVPRLCVYNGRPQYWACTYQGGGGWFTGYSQSDGRAGIVYQSFSTVSSVEAMEAGEAVTDVQLVLDDRCVALVSPDGENQISCYAVTGWNGWDLDRVTSVWRLEMPAISNNQTLVREKIVDLPCEGDVSAATMDDQGTIYILSSGKFFAVKLDGTYTELVRPDCTKKLRTNSMVYLDGSLYMGTGYGILEYVIADEVWNWYPIEILEH